MAHLLEIVIQNEAPPPFYVLCQENITPAPFSGDPYGDVCQTKHTATKIHDPGLLNDSSLSLAVINWISMSDLPIYLRKSGCELISADKRGNRKKRNFKSVASAI